MKILTRPTRPDYEAQLVRQGLRPLLARLLAARGLKEKDCDTLLQPFGEQGLKGLQAAVELLDQFIETKRRILIISDYDADGATACSVGLRGLRSLGANVDFLVPDRAVHGYGLTPAIVQEAAALPRRPELIVTVDNGISSLPGVAEANKLGIPVLVTDHHLPGAVLPDAAVIVNPNQPGCPFPSKALAGCGVMWYVMWALAEHRRAAYDPFDLLPIVAVGTIADVVALDDNNRALVRMGLDRIRRGQTYPGIEALCKVAKRESAKITCSDIAFAIGPRINAAGRLDRMDTGIMCLTTDSGKDAIVYAQDLQAINEKRKEIEGEVVIEALGDLFERAEQEGVDRVSIALFRPGWHQGVVGIAAGRIKERLYRPTFVFGDSDGDEIKGSGRSIPGLHLRDALDLVNTRNPGLIKKFGGHAMAAGVSIYRTDFEWFRTAFEQVCQELLTPAILEQVVETDGELATALMTVPEVLAIEQAVWGQAFPPPLFDGLFEIAEFRRIGQDRKTAKFALRTPEGRIFDAVRFRFEMPEGQVDPVVGEYLKCLYTMSINAYKNEVKVQLMVDQFEVMSAPE